MRSTFSVSTWTRTLAGCLAFFLGCSQGEGDRCEVPSDCSGDLTCVPTGSPNNGICKAGSGSGLGGSTGQGSTSVTTGTTSSTSTGTSTDASAGQVADTSVAPTGGEPDAAVAEPDAALAD